MKPVAWLNESGTFSKEQLSPDAEALFTANQLQQAKVEVLREAAERVNAADGHSTYLVQGQLRRMADELETAK